MQCSDALDSSFSRPPKGVWYCAGEVHMRLLLISALAIMVAQPAGAQLAPPNAAGVTFGHVHLNVRDVEVQKKLWVEHFGGTVVQKGPLVAIKLPNMLIAFQVKAPTG